MIDWLTITSRNAFVGPLNVWRTLRGAFSIPTNYLELLRDRHAVSHQGSMGLVMQDTGRFSMGGKIIAYYWHHFRSSTAILEDITHNW